MTHRPSVDFKNVAPESIVFNPEARAFSGFSASGS